MTADPEAVTRALAEAIEREYQAADPMDEGYRPESWTLARVLASVLASLPDDRLAEAWDQGVEALRLRCEQMMSKSPFVEASATDVLSRCNPYRAALSGGDAT